MTARIIDGTRIANDIKEEARQEAEALKKHSITPGLAAVLVGENPASQIYVSNKVKTCQALGLYSEKIDLPATITTSESPKLDSETPPIMKPVIAAMLPTTSARSAIASAGSRRSRRIASA